VDAVVRAAVTIHECNRRGGKILLFGNGGSAADAQHIAAEFVGRFVRERRPLPAVALTTDTSVLTAIGNDYGFERVFARQVAALGRAGDVVVAISTSGASPNVLAGIDAARGAGLTTIALTGRDGGALAKRADLAIVVPSQSTARIQECHIAVGHVICEIVDSLLLAEGGSAPAAGSTEPGPAGVPKVVDWDTLLTARQRWRAEQRTVVWTNGCFDLLHVGHVRSLQAARALGDVLVVGINSDDSARRLKGPGRPIVPAPERAQILAALEFVDHVVVFDEPTPEAALARLQPEVHCKGAEYAPPHGRPVPEAGIVESYGGRIHYLPLYGTASTSDLMRRVRAREGGEGERDEPRRAVFLDRDGTVIDDVGYPRDPEEVRLRPGAAEALATLAGRGFRLVLVSNQSGLGRGLVTAEEAERVHDRVVATLARHGVRIDAAYYCPHPPDAGCACRKPSPEMLRRAAEELNVDLARSFMIGDKPSDVEAGRLAGCRTILLCADPANHGPAPIPDCVASRWSDALWYIAGHGAGR